MDFCRHSYSINKHVIAVVWSDVVCRLIGTYNQLPPRCVPVVFGLIFFFTTAFIGRVSHDNVNSICNLRSHGDKNVFKIENCNKMFQSSFLLCMKLLHSLCDVVFGGESPSFIVSPANQSSSAFKTTKKRKQADVIIVHS